MRGSAGKPKDESQTQSLMLSSKKHLEWRISIHARFRGVCLRLKASKLLPGWVGGGVTRFSVVVRLRGFLLKLRSGNCGSPAIFRRRRGCASGSTLLLFVKGVLRRWSWPTRLGGDAITPEEKFFQEPVKDVLGSLAFLTHSASHRNHGGVTVHAAVSFFYIILLFKCTLTRRPRFPVAIEALLTALCIFSFSYLHFMNKVSKAAWMICFIFFGFTTLLPLSQCKAIFKGMNMTMTPNFFSNMKIPLLVGRKFRFSWFFVVFLFLFCKMCSIWLFEVFKMIIDGSTTWIPHLFLIYYSFSHAIANQMQPRRLTILISLVYFIVAEIVPSFSNYLEHLNADSVYRIVAGLESYLRCNPIAQNVKHCL